MAVAVKHTQGPWEFRADHPQNACGHVYDDCGAEIATCYAGAVDHAEHDADGIWPDQPIRDANARLIAAAPELYEALNLVLAVLNEAREDESVDCTTQAGGYLCGDVMSESIEVARAALFKAGGGAA